MGFLNVFSCTTLVVLLLVSTGSVVAEDNSSQGATPILGNVMAAVQLRNSKLWYAGKVKNWPLTDYEPL